MRLRVAATAFAVALLGDAGAAGAATAPTTATFVVAPGSGGTLRSGPRRPRYVSPNTAAIAISVDSTPTQTFPCPLATQPSCKITFAVPSGKNTFSVVALSAYGSALSRALFTATCAAGKNTTLRAVLSGVVASADVTVAKPYLLMGKPSSIKLIVTGYDATGAVIIGPGGYTLPILLADSDSSHATSLSTRAVSSPSDEVSLSYDGVSYVDPVITWRPGNASFGGNQSLRLVPELAAVETPIPSGALAASGLALGSDNAMWFSEIAGIGRIGSRITEYALPKGQNAPGAVVLGADGDIWFTAYNNQAFYGEVGKIDPRGKYTIYGVTTSVYQLATVALGPDHNVWFGYINNSFGEVTPAGKIETYTPTWGDGLNIRAGDLVTGPDGNLWIADGGDSVYYKYVPKTGVVTPYDLPYPFQAYRIIVGSNGRFYENGLTSVVETDTSGRTLATYNYDDQVGSYGQMASAFDAIWVPLGLDENQHPVLAHIGTKTGQYAEIALSTTGLSSDSNAAPTAVAAGLGNTLWYLRSHYVGRFTAH